MKIIKEELRFEENLKKRLEFICEFSKVTPTFVNGSIRKIEKTNISYIEPHRVIVKDTTFLVFNYSNMEQVKYLIDMINNMDIKDKLRLAICMSQSKWAGLIYNTKEYYEKFDSMLKNIDEEYRTTLINFGKYKLVMFAQWLNLWKWIQQSKIK